MLSSLEAECATTVLPDPATMRLTMEGEAVSAANTDGLDGGRAWVPRKSASLLFNPAPHHSPAPRESAVTVPSERVILERPRGL